MKERKYVKETPVVVYDKNGLPNMMLKVENTAPTKEQADPIFIVKSVEYDSIYLSRFLNSAVGGQVVSLPFRDPLASISMDDAERGVLSEYGRTETGSGPASWYHNGDKETGIADTIGNVWKIVSGIRLKRGKLEYMPNNDAAAPDADLSEESTEFLEVLADGSPVKIGPGENGMMITTKEVEGWDCVERGDVCIDLKTVPDILKDLGIITDDTESETEIFAADAELDEAICFVGAHWDTSSHSGPSALSFHDPRTYASADIGLFSALLGDPVIR